MGLLSFLPKNYQGIIVMAAGFVLLLHTLGFFEKGLSFLLICGSIYMIVSGFILMDGIHKVSKLFSKKNSH